MEKDLSLFFEFLRVLCRQIMHITTLCATLLDVRMALEIFLQSICYILSLGDNADAAGMYLCILGSNKG